MKISDITASQLQAPSSGLASPTPDDTLSPPHPVHRAKATNGNEDAIRLNTKTAGFALRKFEALNSVMNEVASTIRSADETMQRIGTKIVDMKSALTEIIKQYPPFPPGSEERVTRLKHFSGLRRQIEALSFPPEDTGALGILAPAEKDEHSTAEVDLSLTRLEINTRRLTVNTGPEGLNIPDLPANAGDDQIKKTLSCLSQSQTILDSKRDLLAKDAERITRMQ